MINVKCSRTAALWLVTVLGPSAFSAGPAGTPDGPARPSSTVVPFKLVAGFLVVVDGSIGRLHGLNFVIDTGTTRTVIHQGIARTLRLPPSLSGMQVFGTDVVTESVIAPSLTFGPVHAADVPVLTADLHPQERRFGLRPDVLVGMDVLGGRCFTLDYLAATMTFGCLSGSPARISFNPQAPYPVIDASIDGAPYRLLVDSGSEAIVIFENAIPAGRRIAVEAEVGALHLTGAKLLKRFTAGRFSVGGYDLGTPPVFIMSEVGETPDYDGVVGSRWIGGRVHFDFARRVLSWR